MEFKAISEGVKIPVLGIGTWKMGGALWANKSLDRESITSIKTAVELGMTHIDTAEIYGGGHAEELVGEAIRDFDRKSLFITTKVSPIHLREASVIAAAERSLKRLRTDYLDLYLVHGPNPIIPIQETMRALDFLVEKKITRFIGVSNFSVKRLKAAQSLSKNKIIANQIEYNLLARNRGQYTRNMEQEIVPYCQENGILVVAYRPLAGGQLARPGIELLDEIAKKYSRTQAQVAINWLISKPGVVTIPKATNVEHTRENLGAVGWKMSAEDTERLNRFSS